MIIQRIRKSKLLKVFIIQLIFALLFDIFRPLSIYALTGGPSQPEVQSFEPVNTTQMVDMFSGDFVYNIPLMDIGGYPLNISYHSGITMDQEASWVGLGWNINPGVINRSMRGVPDDFKGDEIIKQTHSKPNKTMGVSVGYATEMLGLNLVSASLGIYYNNYKGLGQTTSIGLGKGPFQLSASYDNQAGISLRPSLSFDQDLKKNENATATPSIKGSVGIGYNSRSGLTQLTIDASANTKNGKTKLSNNASLTSGGYSFASPSYTPSITEGYYSYGMYFDLKPTVSFYGIDPGLSLSGFYNESGIDKDKRKINAYGFMYDGDASETSLRDINREKDAPLSKYTRYLPIPISTYDVYAVSGQGTGGLYKPVHGNVSTISDPKTTSKGMPDGKLTIEIGAGNLYKIGGSAVVTESKVETGMWREGNLSLSSLKPRINAVDDLFESAYFKSAGEQTVMDNNYYSAIGYSLPVCLNLNSSHFLLSSWNINQVLPPVINRANNEYNRERRNTLIAPMVAEEAVSFAVDKDIRSFKQGVPLYYNKTNDDLFYNSEVFNATNRVNYGKSHHFSEITTYNPDGTRYVYGIPAYNRKQKEVTFSVTPGIVCPNFVDIPNRYSTSNPDFSNWGSNEKHDQYYSSTEIPKYAHSYLLTEVLSPDFSDLKGDGPTPDDLGSYTKFNYTWLYHNFKWRTPYTKANFNEMLYSLDDDGKGNYIYGEKDIWYLHNIETKDYVAIFHTTERNDGVEAYGEFTNNPPQYDSRKKPLQLDSISLYARADYFVNTVNATPIKRVHFTYYNKDDSEELCKGIKNSHNNGGKLTLKSIYFTYGNNSRGKYNQYEFNYSDFNPGYNEAKYDRWGNYKNADPSGLKNSDFPYVDQFERRDTVDKWMSAWQLTSIKLPSGGKIEVKYESDDYAYVQDKPAMQMFKIAGCGTSTDFSNSGDHLMDADYLYFKLPDKDNFDPQTWTWTNQKVKDYIIKGIQQLYFNFKVKTVPTLSNDRWEHIVGYCEIDYNYDDGTKYAGVSSNSDYGYVKIKKVDNRNPITVAAWQFARINTPKYVYLASSITENTPPIDIFYLLTGLSAFEEIKNMVLGIDSKFASGDYGKQFNPNSSWVRMNNPDKMKRGGGSRVKQVLMTDEWDAMTNGEAKNAYGQVYDYTMQENGRTISSGVASYEPMIGNDENPFRTPLLTYNEKVALGPNNEFYQENPLGESLYPSPSVGYRKVTVRNYKPENYTINVKHLTGYSVNEFYTAYDFPVRTTNTNINAILPHNTNISNFLKFSVTKEASASQGYAIFLNDMHGKQKAESIYNETNDLITKTAYFYKVDNENAPHKNLNNTVSVVNKDGIVEKNATLGMDIDMVVDSRYKEEKTSTITVNMNLDGFFIAILPIAIPMVLGGYQKITTKTKTSAVCKVINQSGILDRVVVTQDGASLATKNELFDKETGNVLMTSVQNEYGDTIHNLNYPAHWAYENGMGQAFKNHGAELTLKSHVSDSTFIYNDNIHPFVPGDEIYFTGSGDNAYSSISSKQKFWILDVNKVDRKVSVVDVNGINFFMYNDVGNEKTAIVKIIRSGRRNMPEASIGKITTLNKSPFVQVGNDLKLSTGVENALQASAVQFSDKWQTFGAKIVTESRKDLILKRLTYTTKGKILIDLLNSLISNNDSLTIQSDILRAEYPQFFSAFLGSPQFDGLSLLNTCNKIYANFDANKFYIKNEPHYDKNNNINYCYCNKEVILTLKPVDINFTDWRNIIEFNELTLQPDENVPPLFYNNIIAWLQDGSYESFTLEADGNNNVLCNTPFSSHQLDLMKEEVIPTNTFECKSIEPNEIINPYVSGVRGVWRPKKNYVYYDIFNPNTGSNRSVAGNVVTDKNYNHTNTRYDGLLGNIAPFWEPTSGDQWVSASEIDNENSPQNAWLWQTSSQVYSPFGFELENKNVMDIYSSALQGNGQNLPLAVVQNSKLKNILYDGFEDFEQFTRRQFCAVNEHWPRTSLKNYAVQNEAHTGISSLKLENFNSNNALVINIPLANLPGTSNDQFMTSYRLQAEDIIPPFLPENNKYIISYWVKGDVFDSTYDYVDVIPHTNFANIGNIVNVEGWYRIEKSFDVSSSIAIKFSNQNANEIMYIDDLRIFPVKANMKSYVYNPITFRLSAVLDENNYATFYEYDDEGSLVRVKRETARGIMTIKESRQGLFKQVVN